MLRKLESDTIETFFTRIPVMIFSFLYSIFLIRLLGPEGNGIYAFITASVTLVSLIIGFNASGATLFHLSSQHFNSQKVFGLSTVIHFAAIGIITLFCIYLYLIDSGIGYFIVPKEYFSIFYLLFFLGSFILQFLSGLFIVVYKAQKKFRLYNSYLIISHLLQVAIYGIGFFIVSMYDTSLDLVYIFVLILIVQFLITLISFGFFMKYCRIELDFEFRSIQKSFFQYAKLGYLTQIGHFLNKRLDVWFIEFFAGIKNLGFYSLSTQLTNFILLSVAPLSEVLKPYLINMEREEGNKIFINYFKAIFFIIGAASFALFLSAGFIVPILFGKEFVSSILPLRILCIGIVLISLRNSIMNYNRAFNDLKYNVWAQWFGVVVTLIMDILLIPKFGIIGAAWASVAAYGSSFILVGGILLFNQNISIAQLIIPTKKDLFWVKQMVKSRNYFNKS